MSTTDVTHSPARSSGYPGAPELTFGPVPSRRFGRSLGVNNIPPKVCTYSCVYCQVGRTEGLTVERRVFHGPDRIAMEVCCRVLDAQRAPSGIDHITFVPDGEPTLDTDLGEAIRRLRPMGIAIAVITNGSLLNHVGVRDALAEADHVSIKVDAVRERAWRRVNRPHRRLRLESVLEGMREFSSVFGGMLTTETMLVKGVNDCEDDVRATAAFVGELNPAIAYVAVPTRPPAEAWVTAPPEAVLARAWEVFGQYHRRVELLTGYEGDAFASTGDPLADILSIAAVHPMRETAVRCLLSRSGVPWSAVSALVAQQRLVEVLYGGSRYYLRPVAKRCVAPFAPGLTQPDQSL